MKRAVIIETISALLILLFAYTALSKLYGIVGFQWALGKSPLLKSFAPYLAWGLPFLELAISALLFIPQTRRKGLFSSLILLIIFTMYIGYMILFTPKLPCSCGGIVQLISWRGHMVFNSIFSGLAAWALWLDKNQTPIETRAVKSAYT